MPPSKSKSQTQRVLSSGASSSTLQLQRLSSTTTAEGGCLKMRPLRTLSSSSSSSSVPTISSIVVSVAGQRQTTQLLSLSAKPVTIVAPLSHLYQSQVYIQLESTCTNDKDNTNTNSNNTTLLYRGSYSVDELPIHQTAIVTIPLKAQAANALVAVQSSASLPPPQKQTQTQTQTDNAKNNACHDTIISLQVQFQLKGPPRSEIVKFQQALQAWLVLVDRVEDGLVEIWNKLSPQIPKAAKKPEALLVAIPAVVVGLLVPLLTAGVVLAPLFIGVCILFFPIMIPLVVGISLLILVAILGSLVIVCTLYASSRRGRHQLSHWWREQTTLQQYWNIVKGPRFGLQTFYYATGPRPNPVTLTRTQMPKDKWRRLGVSLTIDGVGSFSYLLPFVGEAFDVVWAPTQTVFIMALYQHVSPNMSYVSFAEEILPFLDVLPSATTGWLMEFGPELWEDAKAVLQNPKAAMNYNTNNLHALLWGTTTTTTDATPDSSRVAAANGSAATVSHHRRSLPTPAGRRSRHA